jgi:hypothetical protein
MPELDPILCRASFAAPVVCGPEIMWMPGGIQTITPVGGGIGQPISVLVDRAAASAVEAQRAAIVAGGRSPYFDLNHEDGPASFRPEAFYWKDEPAPGIYARGEWTPTGRAAVEGKEFREFSPVFHVDNKRAKPARIIDGIAAGRTKSSNMGGLVNDAAFQAITPFFAKDSRETPAGASSTQTQTTHTMTEQEIAALQAKNKELETELTTLKSEQQAIKAKNESDALVAAQIAAKSAEIAANTAKLEAEALKAKNDALEAAEKARREALAEKAVAEAVSRGAIAAKDEAAKTQWKALIVADPANEALLAKQAGNPAVNGGRVTNPGVVVVATRPNEVLQALGAIAAKQRTATSMQEKAAIAKEVGAIYAKDVSGNREVLDAPLMAADNTDGNLGILTGTLVSQRTIEDYEQALIPPQFLTTDYSDAPAQFGQTSTTRIVVTPAVEEYDATLDASGYPIGWTISTPAQTVDAPVTLNKHKGVPIVFDANTLASTVRRLFDEQANLAGYALAKDVNDALLALITPTNFPGVAASGSSPGTEPEVIQLADFGRAAFSNASAGFGPIGVPVPGRYCLMNSIYKGRLEQDPTLVSLAVFQKPEIIVAGELPPISKFQPLEAPNLPTTNNLAAFFGHKSALVIQTRLPQDYTKILPGASFGNVSVVTGKTGLSILLVEYVNHNGGYAAWRQAIMYGVAKGNPKGGKVIKSAA